MAWELLPGRGSGPVPDLGSQLAPTEIPPMKTLPILVTALVLSSAAEAFAQG